MTTNTTKENRKKMEKFVVTKEMIEQAADYLPLGQKKDLAKRQAESCVLANPERTGIRGDGGGIIPLPPRYVADESVRSMLEMSVFTCLYLRCRPLEDDQITMDTEAYDFYAGSHIFGQLNAMKGELGKTDPALKQKIVDMIADFNDYQKRLTAEIRVLMTLYNDPVDRFMAMNAAMATPDSMEGLLHELKDAAEAVEAYREERGESEA